MRKSPTEAKDSFPTGLGCLLHIQFCGYFVALVLNPFFFAERDFMTFSNVTRRRLIGGLAAGVSAVSVASSSIGSARAQSTQKTFVLVGGAFYGAWCWHRVTERLEKQGHKVYAFTLTD